MAPRSLGAVDRAAAWRRLSDADAPVGVFDSPIIPVPNDSEIPEVLRSAKQAGARFASGIAPRLPGSVADILEKRIGDAMPHRRLNESAFSRFAAGARGDPVSLESIRRLFEVTARKHGLAQRVGVGSGR